MEKAKKVAVTVSLLNQFGVNLNLQCPVTPPMAVLETNLSHISHMGKNVPFGCPMIPIPIMQMWLLIYYEYMIKFYTQSTWHLSFPFPFSLLFEAQC